MKWGKQLVLEGFGSCACWVRKDSTGIILAAYCCPECVGRALAYLEMLLYIDRPVSVSASKGKGKSYGKKDSP